MSLTDRIEVIVLLGFKSRRLIVTDVSGKAISPIFKGQALREEGCLTLEDGTDELSRNVAKYRSTHRHITMGEYFKYSYLDERDGYDPAYYYSKGQNV